MKTSNPFSTISYNSIEFLKYKLDQQVTRRHINFYAFIRHYPEEDEKKAHIHLIMIPNGTVQTDAYLELLQEYDSSKPDKPLGIKPIQKSKWADWYLYCSHDTAYLASKGMTRKYHYVESDFYTSDEDYLHELVSTIDRTKYTKTQQFVDKVKQGVSFEEMIISGQIPIGAFVQYEKMFQAIINTETYRNGRYTHTPKIDTDTGEVVEPVATETTEPQRATESHRELQRATDGYREPQRATESYRRLQRAKETPRTMQEWLDKYEELKSEDEDLPY